MLPPKVKKINQYTGHTASIFTITPGFTENTLLSGAGDGLIAEWTTDPGDTKANAIARIPANIFSLCTLEKYNLLCAGTMRGGIHIIDVHTKKEIKNLGRNTASIFDLQVHNSVLFAASGEGQAYVWQIPSFELADIIEITYQSIRAVAFTSKTNEVAFACSDHKIYIYDVSNFNIKHILEGHTNSVFTACYSPGGKYLLTGSRDAQLKIWNAENKYTLMHTIPAHLFTINHIAFSNDGKLFATAGRDKTIKLWDAETFDLLKVIDKEKYEGHINSVNKLFWSAHNNLLISCSDDRSIISWQINY